MRKSPVYVLTQDESCHWYIIPEHKYREFCDLANNEDTDHFPEWAVSVGGSPTTVRFPSYEIV